MSDKSTNDLVLRTAALKAISDYTTKAYNAARAEVAGVLGRGDRKMARSPLDDTKLGAVYVTDPKPQCLVTDEAELTEWMAEHYPAAIESGYEIAGSEAEVVAVLFEHAPHLLRRIRRVDSEQLRELRANSIALGAPIGPGGEADVPGIEVHTPDGVVTCKPDAAAIHAVVALFRAGRLELDGTVLPAIEEPGDAA